MAHYASKLLSYLLTNMCVSLFSMMHIYLLLPWFTYIVVGTEILKRWVRVCAVYQIKWLQNTNEIWHHITRYVYGQIMWIIHITTANRELSQCQLCRQWCHNDSLRYRQHDCSHFSVYYSRSAVITRSSTAQYCTHHCRNWCVISIRGRTHKRHPKACSDGRDLGCCSWIFYRKLTVL